MKKKALLFVALVSVLVCLFAIAVSAETPTDYIEFGARFEGSDEYITVYTLNAESDSHPHINFNTYKFYSDAEFTTEVDITTVTGIDFSVTKTYGTTTPVNRMTAPAEPFTKCTEVKWFTQDGAMDNTVKDSLFNGWTALKSFTFGSAVTINHNSFENTGFESIVIPSTIKKINNNAFAKCLSLKSVKFEGALDSVGSSIFTGCSNITTVDLGQLTVIGKGMFNACSSLTSITFPSTVKTVDNEAFLSCSSLKTVTLNNGLVNINSRAFEGTALESVTIPASVELVGEKAFYCVTTLTSVDFSNTTSLTKIGNSAFYSVPASNLTVPSSVQTIGKNAFRKSGITSVYITKNVTSVGEAAFEGCTSVTSIEFEQGFSGTIGSSAFMNTSACTTLTLVEGITSIPSQCFWKTGAIEEVVLPDSVKTLAGRAFADSGIKKLTIRETSQLESITGNSFEGMKSLTSIYLPTGVVLSNTSVFKYCHKLEYVYNFENVVLYSGENANVFNGDVFYECMALKELKLPSSVTTIEGRCHRYNSLEKLYIPASVTSISNDWINNLPTTAVIFYCGGDAEKLQSLTDSSTTLATRISEGKVADYAGLTAEYNEGVIVENTNGCDVYFGGTHLATDEILFAFLDESGNPGGAKYVSPFKAYNPCGRGCGKETIIEALPAFFTELGYSTQENGEGGMVMGFLVDNDAINKYEELTGSELTFGVFAVAKSKLGANDVLKADGSASEGVVKVNVSNTNHRAFELKIAGFETDEQKNSPIAYGAYVIEDVEDAKEITYIQDGTAKDGEKYYFATYNDLNPSV